MGKEPATFVFRGFRKPNYTPVPDELFDELLPFLTGAELKALLYIVRKTFGWKKDSDNISINQMLHGIERSNGEVLDHGVGLTKKTLLSALNSLEHKRIIVTRRRQSRERGWEPTTYGLNVGGRPLGEETPPTLGEKLLQGVGAEIPPRAWGRNYALQETTRQETTKQETSNIHNFGESIDTASSKIRNKDTSVAERADERARRTTARELSTDRPAGRSSQLLGGIQTAAVVLNGRYGRRRAVPSEGRQAIGAYIHDFALELGDQAPLRSSVTRAVRLYEESGLSLGDFISSLHAARSVVKEYSGSIRKGRGEQSTGWKPVNKVPYFFAVLEDQLGLREHPDDEVEAKERQDELPQPQAPAWRTSPVRRPRGPRPRRSIGGPLVPIISPSARAASGGSRVDRDDAAEVPVVAQKRPRSGQVASGGTRGPSDAGAP
jgi:hypothetical protein